MRQQTMLKGVAPAPANYRRLYVRSRLDVKIIRAGSSGSAVWIGINWTSPLRWRDAICRPVLEWQRMVEIRKNQRENVSALVDTNTRMSFISYSADGDVYKSYHPENRHLRPGKKVNLGSTQ
jgi:hypothetical protein